MGLGKECLSAGENIENSEDNLGEFISNESVTTLAFSDNYFLNSFLLIRCTENGKAAFSLAALCTGSGWCGGKENVLAIKLSFVSRA